MKVALAISLLLILTLAAVADTVAASADIPTSRSMYRIDIFYNLINLNGNDILANFTVPIPPTTAWQTSYFIGSSITPQRFPYHDSANNTLIDYSVLVPAYNVTTLKITVNATVTSNPGYPLDLTQPVSRNSIPSGMAMFTAPTYWWNYSDPLFAAPDSRLSSYSGENNLYTIADAVRNETLQDLPNFFVPGSRLGATQALQTGHGAASEYSDLFVALMRSISLPSTRLWSWLVSDVQQGVVRWAGFVQSAIWVPGLNWLPFDVTTSRYVSRPAIGEVSDRIITFYIENNLPSPNIPTNLMLSQDQTFFPGGGSATRQGVLATSHISIVFVPAVTSGAVQLFTLTTTVGVFGLAAILIIIIVAVGYQRARARRRRYQERADEFERRLRGITRG